jgi:hypothetical protein
VPPSVFQIFARLAKFIRKRSLHSALGELDRQSYDSGSGLKGAEEWICNSLAGLNGSFTLTGRLGARSYFFSELRFDEEKVCLNRY